MAEWRFLAGKTWSDAELVKKLSWRPTVLINFMVDNPGDVDPTPVLKVYRRRELEPRSSLRLLETVPLEVRNAILYWLDFPSLARFSLVCRKAKIAVDDYPASRELPKHAPEAMLALVKLRLLSFYPIGVINDALRSKQCVSCGNFGPFLFMPTCERCCFECSRKNRSLWIITLDDAKKFFAVSRSMIKRANIPTMNCDPGSIPRALIYGRDAHAKIRSKDVVSVKDAKRLALEHFGSQQNLVQAVRAQGLADADKDRFEWFVNAPLEPLGVEPCYLPQTATRAEGEKMDYFSGAVTTYFPHLPAGKPIEKGVWCIGCRQSEVQKNLSFLMPNQEDVAKVHRAWTKKDFLKHIKECEGIKLLPPNLRVWRQRWVHYSLD